MKSVLTFIFLICFGVANALTYYIRTDGNNANTGTTNSAGGAWRTLAYATAHATTNGDIIHVVAGTFAETTQSVLASGVSIEGDGITSIITSTVKAAGDSNASFVPLIDATSGSATSNAQHISNCKFDGLLTGSGMIWVGYRNNFTIYNCTIVNFFNYGVIFTATNDFWITSEPASRRTGNSFHDNTLTNCANYDGYGRGCLGLGGQLSMTVYNDTITQNSRAAGLNGWPIKYWNDGWTQGLKIYNNIITKNLFIGGSDWSFCMEIFHGQGTEIYGNTIQGSLDFNFQGDKGTYPYVLYVHNNTISIPSYSNYVQEGIIMEYSVDGMIVEDNTFDHLFNLAAFYPRPGAMIKNVVIQKNLVKNLGSGAASAYFIGGFDAINDTVRNMKILNNTITNDTTPNHNGDFAFRLNGFSSGTVWDSVIIKNNIIKGFSGTAGYMEDITKFTRCQFAYNDINGWDEFGNNNDTLWTPTYSGGYTGYPGTISINHNLKGVQPWFVAGSPYSYFLSAGSPMIGAGTDVGLPFSGAAPDLGYKQYASGTSPTANAGNDTTIVQPVSSLTITGTGTAGSNPIVSEAWTQISGGSTISFTNGTTFSPTLSNLTVVGNYVVRLTVTDNIGNTGSDDRTITVSDLTPPTVSSVTPTNGSTNVAINVTPTATFSEALASGTVNTTNVTLTQGVTNIPITVSLATNVITITPTSSLANSTVYTVTLKTGIQDVNGNALATQYTYSFTTVAGGTPTIQKYILLRVVLVNAH